LSLKQQNESNDASDQDAEDLKNIDKELKDLIDENESLKKGISKLFNEIEKTNTNNSNH
jgi:hypothetical protein